MYHALANHTFYQYPVFPWVLRDYQSDILNLNNPRTFRDLSKPMGAQTLARAELIRERYNEYDPTEHITPAFHYGTHYSR